MNKIQVQGVHHITFVGATRQISIDFLDPLGQRLELACYKFEPLAIEGMVVDTQESLSADREAKHGYVGAVDEP